MPGPDWLIPVVIVALLFGAKKLPELFRNLGRSSSEFKRGLAEGQVDEDTEASQGARPEVRADSPPAEPPETRSDTKHPTD